MVARRSDIYFLLLLSFKIILLSSLKIKFIFSCHEMPWTCHILIHVKSFMPLEFVRTSIKVNALDAIATLHADLPSVGVFVI